MTTDTLVNRLRTHARRLRAAEHGNVLLTFALSLVPIMGAVGAAVDYSRANNIRTQLQAAADAASVGAVAKSSPGHEGRRVMSSDGPIPAGVTDALNIFNAQLAGKSGFTNLSVSATVAKASGDVTSTVQFTASVPTVIMGHLLQGHDGDRRAPPRPPTACPLYVDFYLLLDNTPSMGVGATHGRYRHDGRQHAGPVRLCLPRSVRPTRTTTTRWPRSSGCRCGSTWCAPRPQQLMDTATGDRDPHTNQFRMAIYTFGTSCTNPGLTTIKR